MPPVNEPIVRGRMDAKGPYILWLDYHSEGWHPTSFDTADDAVRYGMEGGTGQPWILTKRVTVTTVDPENDNAA